MNLSNHFTLQEMLRSATATRLGIDNTRIPQEAIYMLEWGAKNVLEPIRNCLGNRPMHIDSGYRCLALNRAIGSHDNSQHRTGNAADFICDAYGSPLQIIKHIHECPAIHYDQLIYEGNWVHVSWRGPGERPRMQTLVASFDKYGDASYRPWAA